jgi:ectoine hydroxylase-related dioxygenase (phytanoyl-CoA dioxygenase family)
MAFGTFMSKGCEGETTFPLHQDPSLMDEERWTPLTFWIPLVDVDVVNGCMYGVPGSHLLQSGPRPSFASFPHPDLQDELRRYLRPIPMRAGQLLIFHSALIHASPDNQSGSLRVATAGVLSMKWRIGATHRGMSSPVGSLRGQRNTSLSNKFDRHAATSVT